MEAYHQGDHATALERFKFAADAGDPDAMRNIGIFFRDGIGVSKNEMEAFQWISRAANSGLPAAQNDLGNLYEEGEGVAPDLVQAVEWYRR